MGRKMREVRDTPVRPAFVCTPRYALRKARSGVRLSRWELAGIAGDSDVAYQYASSVLGARFPEGEVAIASSRQSVVYAANYVGGRWELAEPYIMENAELCVDYSKMVLSGRWESAEGVILRDYSASVRYLRDVVCGRWDDFEVRVADFLCGKKVWNSFWYKRMTAVRDLMRVVRCRVEVVESALMVSDRPGSLYMYALGIGGRLPDPLHGKMMTYAFSEKGKSWSKKYVGFLDRCRERAERYFYFLDEEGRRSFLHKMGC